MLTIFVSGIIVLIITNSAGAKLGAKQGWELCENVVIPALLPILILTNILLLSSCRNVLELVFGRIMGKLLSVPSPCAVAILFGLIGGYPAGAVLTEQLYQQGIIDKNTASRVMCYNFSGGIGFLVMVVGKSCYGSGKIGALLLISNIISAVIVGVITGIWDKKPYLISKKQLSMPFVAAMTTSVELSAKSIINMCGYIILFSSVNGIISVPSFLNPMLEITNGICGDNNIPLDYCAFFLAFGGFCVHFQIIGIISSFGMKYSKFFIYRLASGLLSFLIVRIYCLAYPETSNVFSTINSPISHQFAQVNTALSVLMIVGCAVLVLDIEGRKLKLI